MTTTYYRSYRAETMSGGVAAGAQVTLWDAETGGNQITDGITTLAGVTIVGGILTCDGWGYAPDFRDTLDRPEIWAIGSLSGTITGVSRVLLQPIGAVVSTTGQPHYIGPDFPSSAMDGATWLQTCPGGSVTPQLADGYEDGTGADWSLTGPVTIDRPYAHTGLYGARRAPTAEACNTSWSSSKVTQGQPWAAFEHHFMIEEMPPAGQSAAIFTGQNAAQVDNTDYYINNSGQLSVDMKSTDVRILDEAPEVGVWHVLEGRVFFGAATYQLITRYDGRLQSTLLSNGSGGATTFRSVNLGSYQSQTYVIRTDYTALYVGGQDLGFLSARAPVLRHRVAGVWL